jgi:hypothetical protein
MGKHTKNYGKSPCLIGKSTISMAIFQFANCKRLPGRVLWIELMPNHPESPSGSCHSEKPLVEFQYQWDFTNESPMMA